LYALNCCIFFSIACLNISKAFLTHQW
jgi:hypothetical protein